MFGNDFEGSGRANPNSTHPFIVIKNSGSTPVTRNVTVRRNVFLNWQGASDQGFLLLGEDGQPFHEAEDVLVENNLFLGNAPNPVAAAFTIKGAKNVTFRSNTVTGNLPVNGWCYAVWLGREGANPPNENVFFHNNVWSDPTGSMERFSLGSPENTVNAVLLGNLYYNGGNPIPVDPVRLLNVTDDPEATVADPGLETDQEDLVPPRWYPAAGAFTGGLASIGEVRADLIARYGTSPAASPVVGAADPANSPAEDILGNPRDGSPDLGAVEVADPVAVPEGRRDSGLRLHQNYPNPFHPRTTIPFALDEASEVTLTVYDIRGRKVRSLVSEVLPSGPHAASWDGRDARGRPVPDGVYLCELRAGDARITARMTMMR